METTAAGAAAPPAAEPRAATATADMTEILEYFTIPTIVMTPARRICRVSAGLVDAWGCARDDFVGRDIFDALYSGSPTERFDRIPLAYVIETAVASRRLRVCYAAHSVAGSLWSARVLPVFRGADLLWLVLEWEPAEVHTQLAEGGEVTQSWLPVDDGVRLLIQAVKDYAIFLLDTRGNVATWNTGAELHKGYSRNEIVGRHFSLFYGDEDLRAGKPEKELEICLREGRVEDEGWRYRKDGTRFWANVVITAVYKNGVHVGFGKVTRDLTERKEAEWRLVAAYEESTKLKNDFLANMSHEIRTPMHGMLSACALLLDTPLTEEQRETANIVEESGRVLLGVINDILDYSKLASGTFSIKSGHIEVGPIITSVVRSAQTTLQPDVSLRLALAPDLPPVAEGDSLRYRQIFQNIVGNATKFTDRGSISVLTSLMAEDDDAYIVSTEVADTGPGVQEDARPKLFKPFSQLDTAIDKRHQGTGLGLSIAKSLVQLMDGAIGYRPNPDGAGSIFWFTVKLKKIRSVQPSPRLRPLPDRSSSGGGNHAEQSSSSASRAGAETLDSPRVRLLEVAPQKRILAAEDNIINQKVLVGMLHAFGFRDVTIVSDGSQAMAALANATREFDLVLMDISMPIMNGYEATAHIRARNLQVPIIAMTAYALKGDMELCLEKGMDDYISKPVNRQLLAKKLLRWLTRPVVQR